MSSAGEEINHPAAGTEPTTESGNLLDGSGSSNSLHHPQATIANHHHHNNNNNNIASDDASDGGDPPPADEIATSTTKLGDDDEDHELEHTTDEMVAMVTATAAAAAASHHAMEPAEAAKAVVAAAFAAVAAVEESRMAIDASAEMDPSHPPPPLFTPYAGDTNGEAGHESGGDTTTTTTTTTPHNNHHQRNNNDDDSNPVVFSPNDTDEVVVCQLADTTNEASEAGVPTHRRTGSDVNRKKRLCRFPGCTRVIKSQGHCQRHGAKAKRCKVPGCDKQAQGTHNGMCKRHWRVTHIPEQGSAKAEAARKKELVEQQPPEPQGESVYDTVLPASIAYRPSFSSHQAQKKAAVTGTYEHLDAAGIIASFSPPPSPSSPIVHAMPLVIFLRDGALHHNIGWHRQTERRARGILPCQSLSMQLEPWERQLALVEILLLSGGTPHANFRDLAHAWGRERGFHQVLTSNVCTRRGEVERKKRSDAGKKNGQKQPEQQPQQQQQGNNESVIETGVTAAVDWESYHNSDTIIPSPPQQHPQQQMLALPAQKRPRPTPQEMYHSPPPMPQQQPFGAQVMPQTAATQEIPQPAVATQDFQPPAVAPQHYQPPAPAPQHYPPPAVAQWHQQMQPQQQQQTQQPPPALQNNTINTSTVSGTMAINDSNVGAIDPSAGDGSHVEYSYPTNQDQR